MRGKARSAFRRVDAVLVQAVFAGALSFAHLHEIAAAAGQDGWKSWVYPVSVDLLLVASWRRLRSGAGSKASAWFWFLTALAASLGANVATAGLLDLDDVPAWLRILVAGWPAVAFFGGTLLAHTPAAPGPEPASSPVMEPETAVVVEQVTPPPAPAPAAPELPTAPDPAPAPLPEVPAALVEHARKVADTHRATTGTPIDADTLRARLGLPAPLANALHARLA